MSDKKDELKAKSKQEALENNNEQTLAQSLDEVFRQRSPVSRDDISATRSRKRPVNNSPSVKKMAVDERGSLDDFDDSDFSFVPEENSAKLGDDKTKPKSPGTVPAKTPEELPFGEAAVKDIQANEPQKKDSSAKVKPVVPKVVPVRIDPSKVYPKSSSPEKTAIGGSLESKTLEKPETSKAPATVAPSVPKAKPVQPALGKVHPEKSDPKSTETSKESPASLSPKNAAIGGPLVSKGPEKPEINKAPATLAPSVPKAGPVQPALGKIGPKKSDPKSAETSKESPASLSPKNATIGGPLVSKGPEKPEINKAPATLAPSVPKAGPVQPALGKIGPKKSDPKSAETSKESPASLSPKKAAIGGPLASKGPEKPEINKAPATVAPSVPKAEPVQPAPGKIGPKKSDPKSAETSKESPASLSPKKAAIGGPLVSKGPEKPEINKAPATVAPSVPKAEPVQPALGKIAPKKSDPESEDALKKTLPLPPLNDPKPEVKKEEQSRSTPVSEPVQIKPKAEEMEVVSSNEKKSTSLSQPGSSTKAVSKWAFWRRSSQRDEQLARISDGYVEMVDLVRAIRGQLESQNENNVILRDSLAHLPEAMKGLESFSKSQHTVGEALQEIHGQMKHHSFKDEKLANSMEGFNTTLKGMDDTSKATMQTFDRVQERMRDSDIRMENLFQNVQSAEEKVSDTMVRLQRNMAIMQGIFLFCLIIVIGVLVLTVMKKDNESRTPAQNSAVQPSQPGGQPAGVRPGEVVVPPISEDGR